MDLGWELGTMSVLKLELHPALSILANFSCSTFKCAMVAQLMAKSCLLFVCQVFILRIFQESVCMLRGGSIRNI